MRYEISAFILCHDLRLSAHITTIVEAEKEPSEREIPALLHPAAEKELERSNGGGYRYELQNVKVTRL